MTAQIELTHFAPQTRRFLIDLAATNNRDWFRRNKLRADSEVRRPAERLVDRLSERLAAATGRPVRGKLFRPHRDVRFSDDKTPFYTHLHAAWTLPGGRTDFLRKLRIKPLLCGHFDGLFQTVIWAFLDGGTIALTPLDQLQRLAGDRIGPTFLGCDGKDVRTKVDKLGAFGRLALEDGATGWPIRPPEHCHGLAGNEFKPFDDERGEAFDLARMLDQHVHAGL